MIIPPQVGFRTGARLAAACAALLAAVPAHAQSPAPPARLDSALALATFDSAWSRIRNSHYDTAAVGVRWDGVRTELRPRAAAAATPAELRGVIRAMLGRLGESHFALIPGEAADAIAADGPAQATGAPGDLGMEVRQVGGALVVTRVEAGGPAAAAGVRTGWTLDGAGDFRAARGLAALARLDRPGDRRAAESTLARTAQAYLAGPAGSRVELRLRDSRNRPRVLGATRRVAPGQPVRFGNLPTLISRVERQRIGSAGDCIGVIGMNIWMVPLAAEFDRAVDEFRGCRGLVVDLRGNPGGVAGMVVGLGGHFVAAPTSLGTMRTRRDELRFTANPRRTNPAGLAVEPFAGPVAVLVDGLSASTSELFAGGLQAIGRARVFGERSAGQALPSLALRLPNGDVLQHAIANLTTPRGDRLEGRGVVPDQVVPQTRATLLAGRDAPLDAAVRWIRAQPVVAAPR